MIIIRSKASKGRNQVLADEVRKLFSKGRILVIDITGDEDTFEFLTDWTCINKLYDVEKFIKRGLDGYYNYKYFALNLNVSEHEIDYYKQLENKYKTNFILTVQEHADSNNEEVLIQII